MIAYIDFSKITQRATAFLHIHRNLNDDKGTYNKLTARSKSNEQWKHNNNNKTKLTNKTNNCTHTHVINPLDSIQFQLVWVAIFSVKCSSEMNGKPFGWGNKKSNNNNNKSNFSKHSVCHSFVELPMPRYHNVWPI